MVLKITLSPVIRIITLARSSLASFCPPHSIQRFAGSQDGRIHVWNAENGSKTAVLEGKHPGPLQCVKFNPRYMMLASTCSNMAFWLPTVEE